MKNNYKTNLAMLMDRMKISGNELADATFVNYSLVSKWKNGQRKLNLKSEHMEKVAEYLLYVDKKNENDYIRKLLRRFYDESDLNNPQKLRKLLIDFLALSYKFDEDNRNVFIHKKSCDSNFHNTVCRTYNNTDGLRDALLHFFEHAIEMPPGQELLLLSQLDVSWLAEDSKFLAAWSEHFLEAIKAGQTIKMIHWMNKQSDKLCEIVANWLPLNFTGGIEGWYYPQYVETPVTSMMLIIKNNLAVIANSSKEILPNMTTMFYYDISVVNYYEEIFNSFLRNCRLLTDMFDINNAEKLVQRLEKILEKSERAYIVSDTIPVFVLPIEKIENILVSNNIDKELKLVCLQYYRKLKNTSKSDLRIFLYISSMMETAAADKIYLSELSVLTGKPIYITHKEFEDSILCLIQSIDYSNIEEGIAIVDEIKGNEPINMIVKENTAIVAWPLKNSIKAMSSLESTIVNALYQNCDNLWYTIPETKKNTAYIRKKLSMLLAKD